MIGGSREDKNLTIVYLANIIFCLAKTLTPPLQTEEAMNISVCSFSFLVADR